LATMRSTRSRRNWTGWRWPVAAAPDNLSATSQASADACAGTQTSPGR
jgi:hypothetical protein